MDEEGEDEAARAFEALRAEVTLMRRAVERLAAERTELPEPPDYSETLGVISNNLTATAQRDALVDSPAPRLTPDALSRQIASAGSTVRAEDHRALATARQGLDDTTRLLRGYMVSDRLAYDQNRWLWVTGLIGLVVGMILWAIFAGIIARSVPADWQWPERMPADVLDMEMWDAGKHLMATASPASFGAILAGTRS